MKELKTDKKEYNNSIPSIGMKILSWLLPHDWREIIIGDFIEVFAKNVKTKGRFLAICWFWVQLITSFPSFLKWRKPGFFMFRNYALVAIRNFYRQAGYTLLNLSGLAIGLACFVVIMLYVRDEKSYDRFHSNSDRTYRLLDFRKVDGIGEESASAPLPLGEALKDDYPDQVEQVVRFFNFQAPTLALAYYPEKGEPKQFNERKIYFVDEGFFSTFGFELWKGDPKNALQSPNQIIITRDMALKYFGEEEPIGKTLRFEEKQDLTVAGVFHHLPKNTHLQFDFLVSFSTLLNPDVMETRLRESWIWNPAWTYLVLNEHVDSEQFQSQLDAFVYNHFPESRRDRVKLYLQPVEDIHLHSKLDYEMSANGNMATIRIFTTIAIFILLISCINFINLTTSRSTIRAREIAIRKVLGGYRLQLIGQFLSEAMLSTFIALIMALPVVWVLIQLMNNLSGKSLGLGDLNTPSAVLSILGLTALTGIISGLYPALFLSAYQPVQIAKGGRFIEVFKEHVFRKILVISQFGLSIILIAGTLIAIKQVNYLQEQELGFDHERILLVPSLRSPIMEQYDVFKQRLLQNKEISFVTTVEDVPGMRHQTGGYIPEGYSEQMQFPRLVVHDDFASAMGIDMIVGREFLKEFPTDAGQSVIINEAMVDQLGWGSPESAIGKKIDDETVIGVTKNFHFTSLHKPIGPFVLRRISNEARSLAFSARYIALRLSNQNVAETIDHIENEWFRITHNRPFEYLFLGDLMGTQYEAEATLGKISAAFALLSIFIACLGLFGLASFTTERRIKEIGIRKIMGAPIKSLVYMLCSSFLTLILIAIIIGCPIAYLILNNWLSDFAHRTTIGFWPFLLSGSISIVVVLLTVSYQTIKAVMTNPVNSLKYE